MNEKNKKTKSVRVREICEQRNENKKVLQMSDGTKQAVFFNQPVHVFDENIGVFEDVDCKLALNEKGTHYTNEKGYFTAQFSCEEGKDEVFSVVSGKHKLTVLAACKEKGPKQNKENEILYEKAFVGADIEYTLGTDGVKEKADAYRYPFQYMGFVMPTLPRNPRIKNVEVTLTQAAGVNTTDVLPKLGIYHVEGSLAAGGMQPTGNEILIDYNKMKLTAGENEEVIQYTFDITALLGMAGSNNLMLKFVDEAITDGSSITYAYTDNYLTDVTYQDGRKAVLSYDASSNPSSIYLQNNGVNVYKVEYKFSEDKLTAVIEYAVEWEAVTGNMREILTMGNSNSYTCSPATRKTTVQTIEQRDTDAGETGYDMITTVYTFDEEGEVVSQYTYQSN